MADIRKDRRRSQFGRRLSIHLKRLRREHNLTQEQLATKAAINPVYLGKIEQGVYMPTVYVCWQIAQALGMTVEEFWEGF